MAKEGYFFDKGLFELDFAKTVASAKNLAD